MTVVGPGLILALAMPVAAETSSVDLRHRAYRNWTIELPAEQWFAVSAGFAIPHAGGESFAAALDGTDLRVDTDGDGMLDRTIRATADDFGVRRARLVLKGARADGTVFTYGVRLLDQGQGWTWAPGGVMTGTLPVGEGSIQVRVVDRNGNGRWNDVGEDAIVLGRGNAASFLSRSVHVGGRLWSLNVAPDGQTAQITPYEGETAQLDMTSGFDTSARLLSAIVRSADGEHSFDLAPFQQPIEVPAGSYDIVTGRIGLGQHSVRVAGGRAGPIELAPGELETFDWGGPVTAEFQYMRQGDEVVFTPDAIWYYGAAGEQYGDWSPIGKSPEFTIRDKRTGEVLEVLILPGSC
jgi:hypothetical protein